MLILTNYTISDKLLQEAQEKLPNVDSRLALNTPTGRFFNDPWVIKSEFKNTVWEQILDSLSDFKGEARLIKLEPGEAYPSHADIDDRWHLTIQGNHSYLIDLELQVLHPTIPNGKWYEMNAGIRHTAANFGSTERVQLVVRKLLSTPSITNPKNVIITLKEEVADRRFIFDDVVSPWLNYAYKQGIIDNFNGEDLKATFTVEETHIDNLKNVLSRDFILTVL
jgi:hypothetical protein